MSIKKRKHAQAKMGKVGEDIPSAKMGQIGPSIPSANTNPFEVSAVARLRSARKNVEEAQAPRYKGEVELGPTETQESVKPERMEYYKRLKKRSK
jgi:hypothetical protein